MHPIKRILRYMVKYWKIWIIALISSLASVFLGLISPIFVKTIIDSLMSRKINIVIYYSIGIVILAILQGLASFGQRFYGEVLIQKVMYDLRNEIYIHIHDLSMNFFNKARTGQIIARATGDIENLRGFMRFTINVVISSILTLIIAATIMISMNIELTLVSLSIMPGIYLLVRWFAKNIRPLFETDRKIYGRINTVLQEDISGIKAIKTFVLENIFIKKFGEEIKNYLNIRLKIAKLRAMAWPTLGFLISLGTLLIYWYGGLKVINHTMSLGELTAFVLYLGMLNWPVVSLGFYTVQYERAFAAAERVFSLLDTKPEIVDSPNAIELKNVRGEIVFNNVWFSYDGKKWALKRINLRVKPGEKIALLGPIGSGKTTLVELLLRFYDPQRGKVLIDGNNIRDIKIESLRKNIGVVHQDIFLFADTIRNNISYGKSNATDEEIEKVAKIARIHDFIVSLPKGYNTIIGERGVTLSGGQRQRVAIARALLINPKIIVLDDSTSSVDARTEMEIHEALNELIKNKTVIIITQRLSTLRLADRIIVLDHGRIVEEGTHEELLKKRGLYAKLYMAQFKTQEKLIKIRGR